MRGIPRIFMAVVVLFLTSTAAYAAQAEVPTEYASTVRTNAMRRLNEKVRLVGTVTQYADGGSKNTSFFILKDDWGGIMKIRTSQDLPSVNKRYSIEGPITMDPRTKEVFISEESRTELFKGLEPEVKIHQQEVVSPPKDTATPITLTDPPPREVTAKEPAGRSATPPTRTGTNYTAYLAIGGAVLIILVAAIIIAMRSGRSESDTGDFTLAAATRVDAPPAPEQVLEGKTIKMHAPPPNTVKLQPGWFEVASGDEAVKQIRLYNLGGDHGQETTFGRASGRPYAHIQLKAPTVSSRQAKVFFDAGKAKLTNLATESSNPTRLNGREMSVNEMVPLKENDKIEMGEVSLIFHESQAGVPALV